MRGKRGEEREERKEIRVCHLTKMVRDGLQYRFAATAGMWGCRTPVAPTVSDPRREAASNYIARNTSLLSWRVLTAP